MSAVEMVIFEFFPTQAARMVTTKNCKPLSWTGPKEHRARRGSTAHHACARVRYSLIEHNLSYRGPASCKRFIPPCMHTVMCALLMRAAVDTYFRNAVHACHRSMFMHARHTPANEKKGLGRRRKCRLHARTEPLVQHGSRATRRSSHAQARLRVTVQ